jgi:hypothetical protein
MYKLILFQKNHNFNTLLLSFIIKKSLKLNQLFFMTNKNHHTWFYF